MRPFQRIRIILFSLFVMSVTGTASATYILHLGDETPAQASITDVVTGCIYLKNMSADTPLSMGLEGTDFPPVNLSYAYEDPTAAPQYLLTLIFSTPTNPYVIQPLDEYAFWHFTLSPLSDTVLTGDYTVSLKGPRGSVIDSLEFTAVTGSPVPEPATMMLLGMGLVIVLRLARCRS